ncbi:MAG: SDR family NAD(P)-dependent oxidoreductase [Wujia sp.]
MKVAVITGASSGLGREFAIQISQRFRTLDEIWVMARRLDRLEALAKQIKNVKIRVIGCDVTDTSQLLKYRNLLEAYKPDVRVLVNASGFGKIGRFEDLSEEEQTGMCSLNCTALTRMISITLPYMKSGCANIINIASSAAFVPQPSFAVYSATKSYVLSLSMALNQELKNNGITVTAVCPGPVSTEFFDIAEEHQSSKLYKKLLRAKADKVVRLALSDAYHGSYISVYGFTMKAFRLLCKLLPHNLIIRFIH